MKCAPEAHGFKVREHLVSEPPGRDGPIIKERALEGRLWGGELVEAEVTGRQWFRL